MSATLLAAVPLIPLAAAVLALIAARRRPAWGAACVLAANGFSLVALIALGDAPLHVQTQWLQVGSLDLAVGLSLDALSRYTALLVAGVALSVNVYALGYMAEEPRRGIFFAAMSFFVGAMLALVLASSLLLLFAAWEAVGFASFILIGFRHREPQARSAAMQAFLVTRAGDVLLLLGWLLAWRAAGTDDIAQVLARLTAADASQSLIALVAVLMLGGAIGKSAQLPLSAWLPAAMAGPTPVSALIHSATMVAAGVYLVLRLFPLFEAAPPAMAIIAGIGGASALLAALVATAQRDLKRVLAWSTISHLGGMFFALGLAGPLAAAFQLATHAVYKSALFLAAGAVEQGAGSRALERLGGLARKMPLVAIAFLLAGAALAGVPPLSGYWSEESMLGLAAERSAAAAVFMLLLAALAGMYIGRAGFATFGPWPNAPEPPASRVQPSMSIGIAALALAAAAVGWLLVGRLDELLPFQEISGAGVAWRITAVGCGVLGLAFAAWRLRAFGPIPALGAWPLAFEHSLVAVTNAPARFACELARQVGKIERVLDAATRTGVQLVGSSAAWIAKVEFAFDSGGRATGTAVFASGRFADAAERQVFGQPLDRFALLLGDAGARLRHLETGKVFTYTSGIAIWVLLALVAGVALLF